MKKTMPYIIVFGVSTVLVLAILAALVYFKPSAFSLVASADRHAVSDSTQHADSIKIAEGKSDSAGVHLESIDTSNVQQPVGEQKGGDLSQTQTDTGSNASTGATESVVKKSESDSLEIVEKKKMTQMIELMNPESAVKILNEMSDIEVKSILLNLKRKQASKILSALSPDRAVRIMR
jgi:flagellar motility protein MotE (MotC chaperone)